MYRDPDEETTIQEETGDNRLGSRAVCHRRLQSVKTLIRFGADVNDIQEESVFYNKKVTALYEAVMRGSMGMGRNIDRSRS